MRKAKAPELKTITLPLLVRIPVQARIGKSATIKDLAKLCFMFGLEVDFDTKRAKKK